MQIFLRPSFGIDLMARHGQLAAKSRDKCGDSHTAHEGSLDVRTPDGVFSGTLPLARRGRQTRGGEHERLGHFPVSFVCVWMLGRGEVVCRVRPRWEVDAQLIQGPLASRRGRSLFDGRWQEGPGRGGLRLRRHVELVLRCPRQTSSIVLKRECVCVYVYVRLCEGRCRFK